SMSRRSVRGETCSCRASSSPGQYRRVCSRDSSRNVRGLGLALLLVSFHFGQKPAALCPSVSFDTGKPEGEIMTASPPNPAAGTQADPERADILAGLAAARHFLRFTVRDLTDEQARQHTTASELTLGGLIKHVAAVEQGWADFVLDGPSAMTDYSA